MNDAQTGKQVAQPADEEIKNHGDQLAQQVKDAAGKKSSEQEKDQNKPG